MRYKNIRKNIIYSLNKLLFKNNDILIYSQILKYLFTIIRFIFKLFFSFHFNNFIKNYI